MEKVLRVEDGKYVTGEMISGEIELMKLLWTNPSPTTAFTTQTISLDLSEYDFIEVCYRYMDSDTSILTAKGAVGIKNYIHDCFPSSLASRGTHSAERYFDVSTTGITFGSAYTGYTGQASTIDDNRLVPTKIYGIKNKLQAIGSEIATTADKCMLSDGVTSVEDKLDDVDTKLWKRIAYVEPTATQTYAQVLQALMNQAGTLNLRRNYMIRYGTGGTKYISVAAAEGSDSLNFTLTTYQYSSSRVAITGFSMNGSSSKAGMLYVAQSGTVYSDISSTVAGSSLTFELYEQTV